MFPLFREKNKKWAEQGAALVCLYFLGVIDEESLSASGNIISRWYQDLSHLFNVSEDTWCDYKKKRNAHM